MFLTPASVNKDSGCDQSDRQEAIQNLSAFSGHPISQPVGQQHRGIAKPIVLQFARPFLLEFRQRISSCKNAQSSAFNLVYDRGNSEFNDRSERCQAGRGIAGILISERLESQLQLGSFLLDKSPTRVGTLKTIFQSKTQRKIATLKRLSVIK